jgi:uncharacterized protein (TIGR03435 family)
MSYAKKRAVPTMAILILATGAMPGISQSRAQSPLTFEVASVKPGIRGAPYGVSGPTAGRQRYVATNSPLMVMIMRAYGVTDSQIQGAPNWMIFDPWDVEAKAERPSSALELQEMFRALLAERFKLRFRRETKEANAYVLSVDKSGARLKLSTSTESPDTPIKKGDRPGERVGNAVSMSYLCWYLNFTFDAPIVNQTGLEGLYDFSLELPPAPLSPQTETSQPRRSDDSMERNADMISALRQIGLKLEHHKAPVEFFIVEHVERPSEN